MPRSRGSRPRFTGKNPAAVVQHGAAHGAGASQGFGTRLPGVAEGATGPKRESCRVHGALALTGL